MRSVYAVTDTPNQNLLNMLARHPNPAIHKCTIDEAEHSIYLFCQTHESITGRPADNVIELYKAGLQSDGLDDPEVGVLTHTELLAKTHDLLTGDQLGSEVQVMPAQYRFLIETLFKTVEEETP